MSKTSCFRAKRDKNPVGFILLTGLLQRSPKPQIARPPLFNVVIRGNLSGA
jgi:hypothetical protein